MAASDSIPFVVTERLTIDAFQPQDAAPLAAYRAQSNVARYQSWETYDEATAKKFIAKLQGARPETLGEWYQFALRLKDGRLIGDIGFRRRPNGPAFDADLGYTLDPRFQRRGYMGEAIPCLIAWARVTLGVRRFLASVDPRNERSIRMLTRLGFLQEALHRRSCWFKGEWVDDAVYVLGPVEDEAQHT